MTLEPDESATLAPWKLNRAGQVKKTYRRRRLHHVECLLRLGDSARLPERLKTLGLSGSPNTASVERLNLTLRHTLAALPHHSWATAQLTGELLAHLIWANVRAWGAIEDKMIRR